MIIYNDYISSIIHNNNISDFTNGYIYLDENKLNILTWDFNDIITFNNGAFSSLKYYVDIVNNNNTFYYKYNLNNRNDDIIDNIIINTSNNNIKVSICIDNKEYDNISEIILACSYSTKVFIKIVLLNTINNYDTINIKYKSYILDNNIRKIFKNNIILTDLYKYDKGKMTLNI
jgi:hypothetical protein